MTNPILLPSERRRMIRPTIRDTSLEGLILMKENMILAAQVQTPYDQRFMWELLQEIAFKRRP